MLNSRLVCTLGLALSLTPLSNAAVVYQTGFEPSEGYATGTLSGQQGWFGSSVPVVQGGTVFAGTQAVSWAATNSSAAAALPLIYNSLSDPNKVVQFDIEFMDSTTGSPSNWNVLVAAGNNGGIGIVFLTPSGDAKLSTTAGNVGSVAVSRGAWHDFELSLDFNTQIVSAFVDSTFIASAPFSHTATSLSDLFISNGNLPGTDTGFFDNLLVESIPEPGSAALAAMACITLLAIRARKSSV